jgi:alpha-1,2-mannosyltransferase
LLYRPFSGKVGFAFSVLLAVIAAMQLLPGVKFLNSRETALAPAMLALFGAEQVREWITTLGLPSLYGGFDFSAYYLAAKLVSRKPGQNLYDLPLYADGRMNLNASAPLHSAWQSAAIRFHVPFAAPYIYPPFFSVVMKPLAYLSFDTAFISWKIIMVLLLGLAVMLSLKLGGIPIGRKLALILGVGLFSYYPLGDSLFMGQIDCLILFLLAASVWLLAKNQTLASAFCFAAATLLKLTPVLAIPLFLFHRRWKWLSAYAAWMGSLLIVSVNQAGWAMHRQFWRVVMPSISCGSSACQNSSLVAYVQQLYQREAPSVAPVTIPPHACALSRLVAFAVYSLLLVRFYRRPRDGELVRGLVLMVLVELAVSPIAWWHHYTIALLPFLYLWCTIPKKGDAALIALFVIVGTNIVGYSLLLTENHMAQLMLAAIVPCLTLMLVYRTLGAAPLTVEGMEP